MSLLLLSASLPVRLSAQVIDTVVVVNRNVFDLEADGAAPGFLARLANALHVRTRPRVIRRALLVNPGDPYDSARVAESERALRGLFVFSRVRLDTVRIRGRLDRKSTRLNSSHDQISYAVFCLKKKNDIRQRQ